MRLREEAKSLGIFFVKIALNYSQEALVRQRTAPSPTSAVLG
jgi:hypothetical protein